MVKFGGNGKSKQACRLKVCENMTVEKDQAETSGEDDEENNNGNANQKSPKVSQLLDSKLKDKHTPNQILY